MIPCVTYFWRAGRCHWEIRLDGSTVESDFAGYADTEARAKFDAESCARRWDIRGMDQDRSYL